MAGAEVILKDTTLSGDDDDGHRTYSTVWLVRTTDRQDGPGTALAYLQSQKEETRRGGIYKYGKETDAWAFCRKVPTVSLVSEEQSKRLWKVVVEHTTKGGKRCAEENIDDPLKIPPKISGSFVAYTVPAHYDKDGKPILTTAHQPILPAPEVEDHQDTLVYDVNTARINLALRAQFRGTVNSTPIWGLPARCVKIVQWAYSEAWYGECYCYIQHHLEFAIRDAAHPFVFQAQNRGTYELNDDGRPVPINFKDEPMDMANLGSNGKQLFPGDGEWNNGEGITLSFPIEREIDYHLLPILDPLPGPYE